MSKDDTSGPIFTATQLILAYAGGDFLTLLASTLTRVSLLGLTLQQVATAVQPMSVELFRGSTSVGAGGAAVASVNRDGWTGVSTARSSVLGPPTVGNSTIASSRVLADGISLGDGRFSWEPSYPPNLKGLDTFFGRCSTSTSSTAGFPLAVTLTYQETGKMPV